MVNQSFIKNHYNLKYLDYHKESCLLLTKYLIDFLDSCIGKNIVDLGSGPGHDVNFFSKHGFSVLGVDFSRNMIDFSKEKYRGHFIHEDIFNFNEFQIYNNVWASAILMHFNNQQIEILFKKIFKQSGQRSNIGIIIPICNRRDKPYTLKLYQNHFLKIRKIDFYLNFLIANHFSIEIADKFLYLDKPWGYIRARVDKTKSI